MTAVDRVGDVLPNAANVIGKITDTIAGGVGRFVSFGNIFFILLICLIIWGLYKIWRIDVKNKEYFYNRNREI